jgi:O-antigen/teichoic acid export membrane protein
MKETNTNNSYKKLFSNTIIFAIGSFSSKILVFILLPLYTSALSQEAYGVADLLVQSANLLIPIVTLAITESVIRFGLDKKYNKKTVFTASLMIILCGMIVLAAVMPFISMIKYVKGYGLLLYVYVFIASIKLHVSEFIRAKQYVKLYAFNGILTTFSMLILNIIFLLVLKIGVLGYLLAIVLSDVISILFLTYIAQLYKYFSLKSLKKSVMKQMLVFSVPLMPAMIMWWITNVSDRFLVQGYLGEGANGIYAAAYKIPTIITTIYSMFNQAWNLSAITEYDSKKKEKFYSNVFNSNQSIIYVVAGGILLFLIPLTEILMSDKFFIAYKYTPILVLASIFTCFTSFFGSIYAATKKSKNSLYTILFGAILNIILNIILIPRIGINGASIATVVSYFLIFFLRIIDINRFMKIRVNIINMILSMMLLIVMTASTLLMEKFLFIPLILCFITLVIINFSVILKSAKAVLPERIKSKISFLR